MCNTRTNNAYTLYAPSVITVFLTSFPVCSLYRTDKNVQYLAIILKPLDPARPGGLRNSTELPELRLGLLQSSRRIPVVLSRRSGLLRALCCSPDEDIAASPSTARCIPSLLTAATRRQQLQADGAVDGLWMGCGRALDGCGWAVYGLWMGCGWTWMSCEWAIYGP